MPFFDAVQQLFLCTKYISLPLFKHFAAAEFVVVDNAWVVMPGDFGTENIAEIEHTEGLVGDFIVFCFFAHFNHAAQVVVNGVGVFALCAVALSGVLRNDESAYGS